MLENYIDLKIFISYLENDIDFINFISTCKYYRTFSKCRKINQMVNLLHVENYVDKFNFINIFHNNTIIDVTKIPDCVEKIILHDHITDIRCLQELTNLRNIKIGSKITDFSIINYFENKKYKLKLIGQILGNFCFSETSIHKKTWLMTFDIIKNNNIDYQYLTSKHVCKNIIFLLIVKDLFDPEYHSFLVKFNVIFIWLFNEKKIINNINSTKNHPLSKYLDYLPLYMEDIINREIINELIIIFNKMSKRVKKTWNYKKYQKIVGIQVVD